MLAFRDFFGPYNVSVANFPLSRFVWKNLSALYLLAIGSIADLIPRCVVTLNVALARWMPMPNLSASVSSVTFVCRSVETKVLLSGTSCPNWLLVAASLTCTLDIANSLRVTSTGLIS